MEIRNAITENTPQLDAAMGEIEINNTDEEKSDDKVPTEDTDENTLQIYIVRTKVSVQIKTQERNRI